MDFQTRHRGSIMRYIFGLHLKHLNDIRTNSIRCIFHEFYAQISFSIGLKSRDRSTIYPWRHPKAFKHNKNESILFRISRIIDTEGLAYHSRGVIEMRYCDVSLANIENNATIPK